MDKTNLRTLNWGIIAVLALLGISLGSLLTAIIPNLSPYIAPNPEKLFQKLFEAPADWVKAMFYTSFMSLLAAVLSVIIGTTVGYIAAFFRLWSIDRWVQLIWSIPLIAIATYLLLLVGYGWAYGLTLAVFLGVYPIEKHVFDFCSMKSEGVNSLAAAFALTRRQEFGHLRLPASMRALGTALGQALPLCFIGETMGEYTSARISKFSIGLGGHLRYAQYTPDYAELWLSIILMMFLVFASGQIAQLVWNLKYPHAYYREDVR